MGWHFRIYASAAAVFTGSPPPKDAVLTVRKKVSKPQRQLAGQDQLSKPFPGKVSDPSPQRKDTCLEPPHTTQSESDSVVAAHDGMWLLIGRQRSQDRQSGHKDALGSHGHLEQSHVPALLAFLGVSHQQHSTRGPCGTIQRGQTIYLFTCQWSEQRSWPVTRNSPTPGSWLVPKTLYEHGAAPLGLERKEDSHDEAL